MTRCQAATVLAVLLFGAQASANPGETPREDAGEEAQKSDTDVAVAAGNPARVASAAPSMVDPIPVEPPPPAPPEPVGLAAFAEGDASAGHAFISPTAMTGARGTGSLTIVAPAIPVAAGALVGYSPHDRIEIAAGGAAPFEESEDGVFVVSAKAQVVRARTGAVAVQLMHVSADGGDDSITMVSGAGSKCLDAACRTVATLHVTAVPMDRYNYDSGQDESAIVLWGGGSLITGGRIKLVLDTVIVDDGDSSADQVVLGYAGLRAARRTWALDVGFAAAWAGDDIEPAPVPLLGLGARF